MTSSHFCLSSSFYLLPLCLSLKRQSDTANGLFCFAGDVKPILPYLGESNRKGDEFSFFLFLYFFCGEAHPVTLRDYSRICTRKLLMAWGTIWDARGSSRGLSYASASKAYALLLHVTALAPILFIF